MSIEPEAVLHFWFGEDWFREDWFGEGSSSEGIDAPSAIGLRAAVWYGASDEFDGQIRDRFHDAPERALGGEFDEWLGAARSALALVIVLDQFPRNLYRDDARSFAYDSRALEIASEAIERGFDTRLHPVEAAFLYLPFEHSETLSDQDRCVSLFASLRECAPASFAGLIDQNCDYAARHRSVIQRFGRFPHRNQALGREATDSERAYLESGGETFGTTQEA